VEPAKADTITVTESLSGIGLSEEESGDVGTPDFDIMYEAECNL